MRVLGATARALNKRNGRPALPPLLLLTDPKRIPAPLAAAARLPAGAGVVYRHFGAKDREATARALLRLCRKRGLKLLIGADPILAQRVGADGVHLPERLARLAAGLRRAHPAWLLTLAWHGRRRRAAPVDALVLAPVLASASPSAAYPLGARRANAMARRAGLPCYALGGVNARTASRLTGFAGLAAVDGLS
jgi:thiamine-phosphate pyrophosphorylase